MYTRFVYFSKSYFLPDMSPSAKSLLIRINKARKNFVKNYSASYPESAHDTSHVIGNLLTDGRVPVFPITRQGESTVESIEKYLMPSYMAKLAQDKKPLKKIPFNPNEDRFLTNDERSHLHDIVSTVNGDKDKRDALLGLHSINRRTVDRGKHVEREQYSKEFSPLTNYNGFLNDFNFDESMTPKGINKRKVYERSKVPYYLDGIIFSIDYNKNRIINFKYMN